MLYEATATVESFYQYMEFLGWVVVSGVLLGLFGVLIMWANES